MSGAKELQSNNPDYDQLLEILDMVRYMGVQRELDPLLRYIAEHGAKTIDAERCSIFLLDREHRRIWSRVMLGELRTIEFAQGTGIAGHCIETGESLIIDDAYASPLFNPRIDKETGYKTRNILTVPFRNFNDEVTGCFEVINKRNGDFTQADRSLIAAFAAQSAIAIESAMLHQYREEMISHLTRTKVHLENALKHMEVVHELEIASGNIEGIDELMDIAVLRAAGAVNGEAGAIIIMHPGGKVSYHVAREGKRAFHLHRGSPDPAWEADLNLTTSHDTRIINDIKAADQHPTGIEKILNQKARSLLTVPLNQDASKRTRSGGVITGVVEVINKKKGEFNNDDKVFLEIIASQIGNILERKYWKDEDDKDRRLSMIGQLSSSIIHDFRSPMAAIQGFADLVLMSPEMPKDEIDEYFKVISTQITRCNNMTEELLAFSRGEKNFQIVSVDLEKFWQEVVRTLHLQADRLKIAIETDLQMAGSLMMDREKMMRVIFNIANNAFEILEAGSTLRISSKDLGDDVEFRITDNGPGVPEKFRAHLFEAFATHGKARGTGLGLHIAHDIIEHHKGKIYLDETWTDGASFVIRIPKSIKE